MTGRVAGRLVDAFETRVDLFSGDAFIAKDLGRA